MKRFIILLIALLLPVSALALTSVPEGVLTVEDEAFANSGVDALIIPATVTQVGANVLCGSGAAYLYLEGADTVLSEGAATGVAFVFGPADSSAAALENFYAADSLVLQDGLYYAVTDTALPLCPQDASALTGRVTIPKLLEGAPVTSLDALFLSTAAPSELLVPAYLDLPEGLAATPYETLSVSVPVPDVSEVSAGQSITWSTSAEGAYGEVSYLWTFTMNGEVSTEVTAEPTISYIPQAEGSCTATVSVVDALGDEAASAESEAVTVSAGQRTFRALLVGNTYPGELGSLAGCDTDIAAMQTMLSTMSGTRFQITRMLNIDAEAIRSNILTVFADAQEGDVSLFYYSGHGAADGSLVGTGNTFLPVYSLRTALQEIPGTKVVILDCCFSGAVINRSADGEESPADFNNAIISAFASLSSTSRSAVNLEDEGYIVLTACSKDQESKTLTDYGRGISFGAFTYSLCYGSGYDEWNIELLSSMPADTNGNGAITLGEAYADILPRVEYLNSLVGGTMEQIAQYYGSTSYILWAK